MRINKGVDNGSVAINPLKFDQAVSEGQVSQFKVNKAIIRLCVSVEGHSHFLGVSHVVGISMIVGIRIFNIVRYSGLGGGLFRVCEMLLLVGLVQHLLHMLKKQVLVWGWGKS